MQSGRGCPAGIRRLPQRPDDRSTGWTWRRLDRATLPCRPSSPDSALCRINALVVQRLTALPKSQGDAQNADCRFTHKKVFNTMTSGGLNDFGKIDFE
jgi:hypothetical protein